MMEARTAKKIMLIRPASVFSKGRVGSGSVTPALGIAYLASCLRKEGHNVQCIDAAGENLKRITPFDHFDLLGLTNEEILERVPDDIDVFGFSSMFSNEWIYLKKLIDLIKEKVPTAVTILGGEHASALPKYSLESCPGLDYVVSGEGEGAITEFAKCLFQAPDRVPTIGGLSYHVDGTVKSNPKSPRIQAIDDIPYPAWDLLPVENYLREGIASISRKGQRVLPMLASRGCPFECKFCSNPQTYGVNYYVRNIDDFVRELKFLMDRYGITGFELHDLTFIIKKSWVKDLCRRLIREDMNLSWNVPNTRSEAIDDEVVQLLRESGCKNLCLTPDSGSPRMIKEMLKKVNLDRIAHTARVILKNGIILKTNIVFGFPGERHRDVWCSILYGMKLAFYGVDSVLFYRFVPYPGSAYFEQLRSEGKLPAFGPLFDEFLIKNVYNELSHMKSYSEHISDRMIRFYMFAGYVLTQATFFIVHPWEIFRTIKRLIRKSPTSQLDLLIIALLRKRFGLFADTANT